MRFIFKYTMLCLAAAMLWGCRNYADLPELPPLAAVAERSGELPGHQNEINNYLKALANEPYPDYVIGPGDRISVQVYENPELGVKLNAVSPDGEISCMLLGPVKVGGLTIGEATLLLEELYSKYLVFSRVQIQLDQINSMYATIAGKVYKGGRYPVNRLVRLTDLFAMAEGTPQERVDIQLVELADLNASVFVRDNKIVPINFRKALVYGDPIHNLVIRKNDYVFIATRTNKVVSVIGEVNRPGTIIWHENMGLMEAISQARGMKETALRRVIVIRGGFDNPAIYRVEYDEILAGKAMNPALRANDIVYVPPDSISMYNVFVRKLMPTTQILGSIFGNIQEYREVERDNNGN